MEESVKLKDKIRRLMPLGLLLALAAAPVSAQNSLPSPHDESCWESVSTLHACVLEQYQREMEQAERCTSYPEYQCTPTPEPNASEMEWAKKTPKPSRGKTYAREKAAPRSDTVARSVPVQASGSH
jgi:hypothetical protein